MQLNDLKRRTANKTKKRVGRGGTRGKTSGRGHKGQKARAGGGGRPEIRDMIKKLPKLRGHGVNRSRTVNAGRVDPEVINVGTLNGLFSDGERITPKLLLSKKLVSRNKGRTPKVKILGNGELSKKFTIVGSEVSKSAKEAIEKAGGTIE